MSNKPFTVYRGTFLCKECKKEVYSMRLWVDTGKASWMCSDKHVSEVQLIYVKGMYRDREERV
jgi:hypothetical protein